MKKRTQTAISARVDNICLGYLKRNNIKVNSAINWALELYIVLDKCEQIFKERDVMNQDNKKAMDKFVIDQLRYLRRFPVINRAVGAYERK